MKWRRNSIAFFCLLATWSVVAGYAQQPNANQKRSTSAVTNNAAFILDMIDESAVAQFRNAWRLAGAGTDKIEAVVLLYRKIDGSLEATLAPMTYQFERSEFRWNAAIFGVVHTHPNCDDSRPSHEDLRLAKRFNVPVFTITSRGMYMYDPEKDKISRVQSDLDWLDRSKWRLNSDLALNN
jgi:hypothetical protein